MKQGIKLLLPVSIGIDMDAVSKIEFVLVQGDKKLTWEYPSARTIADGNIVNLIFTESETWEFTPNMAISIDTRITLKDSEYQPETEIVKVFMRGTLFEKED